MARSAVCLIACAAALTLPACGGDDEASAPAKSGKPAATATPTATEDRGFGY